MKGFMNVCRAAAPNRRHSVRFLYGISPFRNNRFWTTTFQNDATSISGCTANTSVLSSPSVCRRGAFGELFLLKKWKTIDTGKKPSSMTLNFINNRSRIKTFRDDDNSIVWGVRTATAGFTLIELLVVVLIIGILAAVAVPQYEKVVEKTRAMEAVGLVRSVRHAQELYYMQNSRYASSLDSLTLSFPQSLAKNFHWDGPDQLKNGRFAISRSAEKYFYVIVASGDFRGRHLPGKIYCAAQPSNKKAVEICSEIGSSEEDSDGSWRRFVIQ